MTLARLSCCIPVEDNDYTTEMRAEMQMFRRPSIVIRCRKYPLSWQNMVMASATVTEAVLQQARLSLALMPLSSDSC